MEMVSELEFEGKGKKRGTGRKSLASKQHEHGAMNM